MIERTPLVLAPAEALRSCKGVVVEVVVVVVVVEVVVVVVVEVVVVVVVEVVVVVVVVVVVELLTLRPEKDFGIWFTGGAGGEVT